MTVELFEKETIQFKLGSEQVEVYFRRPNAGEMVRYLARSLSGKSTESLEPLLDAGIDLASACILGVKEGDIVLIDSGCRTTLATDPSRPDYVSNWKEQLRDKLPGLLLMLGNHLVKLTRSELEVREKN